MPKMLSLTWMLVTPRRRGKLMDSIKFRCWRMNWSRGITWVTLYVKATTPTRTASVLMWRPNDRARENCTASKLLPDISTTSTTSSTNEQPAHCNTSSFRQENRQHRKSKEQTRKNRQANRRKINLIPNRIDWLENTVNNYANYQIGLLWIWKHHKQIPKSAQPWWWTCALSECFPVLFYMFIIYHV